jgi:hypothetical protein
MKKHQDQILDRHQASTTKREKAMKVTKIVIAALATTFFTGAAVANTDQQAGYILYEVDSVSSSSSKPFSISSNNPRDNRDDVIDKVETLTPASPHVPYEQVRDDRDNRRDMIDIVS